MIRVQKERKEFSKIENCIRNALSEEQQVQRPSAIKKTKTVNSEGFGLRGEKLHMRLKS